MNRHVPLLGRRRWCLLAASTITAAVRQGHCHGAEWTASRVFGRWRLHTTFSLSEPDRYSQQLVQLEHDIQQHLALPASSQSVTVIILRNRAQYQRYVTTYFPTAPRRPALFMQGQGPGIVLAYRSQNLTVDLRHEGTHGFLHASLPFVPLWLDEGLAEYFESPRPGRLEHSQHRKSQIKRVRSAHVPSLPQLEALEKLESMTAEDYEAAWSWVFLLLHASSWHRQTLRGYLLSWRDNRLPEPLSVTLQQAGSLADQYLTFWRRQLAG